MGKRWTSAGIGAALVAGAAALVFGLGIVPFTANSAGRGAEVHLPAKVAPDQRTALELELGFGKGARGTAVVVRHQPSGEVIGTISPFGLDANGGVERFALVLPQSLEAQLRRTHQPLRVVLDAADGETDNVVLRSAASKLVPTAR